MKKEKKEKKEKKPSKLKKIKKVITPRRIAIVSAIITFVSFGYKFSIGIMATSLVMIIAAFPTLFVFVCKALFARNMNQTRKQKKRAYIFMTAAAVSFSTLFIMFSVLKVGGIDITNKNRFEGWIGTIFIFFIILMFVLSIMNLSKALNKSDLLSIGIKEMSFIAALADAMMIQEFLYRVLLKYLHLPFMNYINKYFPLLVGVMMIIVSFIMLRRCLTYKVEEETVIEEKPNEEIEEAKQEEEVKPEEQLEIKEKQS